MNHPTMGDGPCPRTWLELRLKFTDEEVILIAGKAESELTDEELHTALKNFVQECIDLSLRIRQKHKNTVVPSEPGPIAPING